jgi:hypothetical protein
MSCSLSRVSPLLLPGVQGSYHVSCHEGGGAGNTWSTRCLVPFLGSRLVESCVWRSSRSLHATLHEERLCKDRFGHAADAACVGFLRWVFPESLSDVVWTTADGRRDCVPHTWKQEEVTLRERLCRQHPVGWRRHRIILTLQDQRRDATPDRFLLDRRDRFYSPQLTGSVATQEKVEQCRLDRRRKSLDGGL